MRQDAKQPSSLADSRLAPRSTPVLRSGKVVCQSGEYLCMMRDVSTGGVGLRFFHAPPPEPRIFLQLANGKVLPIERVWSRDHDAGYRFAAVVDVDEFISEGAMQPPRPIRVRLSLPALVTVDGRDGPARLADISRTGARIDADRQWPLEAFVRLEASGLPLLFGHIRWRDGTAHGIVFQNVLPLEKLAQHLLELQPFGAAESAPSDRTIRAA